MQDEAYPPEVVERFWAKVDKNGPVPEHRPDLGRCWLWTRSKTHHGYGQVRPRRPGTPMGTHRFAWIITHGPLARSWDLDHLCRTPSCVRPAHLEPVTHTENMRRGAVTKLSLEIARAIRASSESRVRLGRFYGVHPTTIADIRAGRTWREGPST